MSKAFIYHQHKKIYFEIPSQWNVLTFAKFDGYPSQRDVRELTKKTLTAPIHAKTLKDSLSPSDKIAIIVEDLTRASPKRLILETLVKELEAVRIPSENISVIIALGTHRGLTTEELESTFGRELTDKYEFINHDCHASDLASVGRLKTGREVKINRRVHDATFRIGIGSIFPHPMNGFGGGGKILFPGVSDFDSIREHHLEYTFHEGTGLGKIEGNAFYEQVCSIARAAGLDYVINSILDQRDQVYDLVSGDPVQAHLAGIEKSKDIICHKFPKKSDLTIITSFPYTEGPQIVKPLAPAAMVTKEGGCIILAADCEGHLPDAFVDSFERFHSKYSDNLMGGVLDHFESNRLIMEGGAIDFNMALGMTLATQHRFKIILVSKDISQESGEKMGFMYAADLEQAFDLSAHICPPNPEVHIIPSGGVILPVI
ncbi:MAG: nickel-dependent lactate racemase [Desulfobacteraceae bacterium]|nr:MAG: nickel-dependent lactate racemase [Desulfobacteraceae bacterium]